jgi:nucleoside-diphosphate-sugar epimerase
MKVLITGSRGYIGSKLCEMTIKLKSKIKISGMDSDFYKKKQKKNLEEKFLKKDIRDIKKKDLKGIDSVIHLASLSNDPLGSLNSQLTEEINYNATIKLANFAKIQNVKRFIFISTQSIYGISKYKNKTIKENDKNIKPITVYAKTKLKAEKKLLKMANENFLVTILRPSTVHGPSKNFRSDIVLNNLCASAFSQNKIIINTNGKPYRPVLFIDDICKIIISCLFKKKKLINKKIFNVGYPKKNFTILQIAKMVKKVFKKSAIIVLNQPSHDERSYKVNFDLISKTFSDVINFKKKNIISDIIKIRSFFRKEKFTFQTLNGEKTNRIKMLKKLMKEKKINKNLRFNNV